MDYWSEQNADPHESVQYSDAKRIWSKLCMTQLKLSSRELLGGMSGNAFRTVIIGITIPVVPHKAVAEVSKIGNL